jgi:hypothetical protein
VTANAGPNDSDPLDYCMFAGRTGGWISTTFEHEKKWLNEFDIAPDAGV